MTGGHHKAQGPRGLLVWFRHMSNTITSPGINPCIRSLCKVEADGTAFIAPLKERTAFAIARSALLIDLKHNGFIPAT